MKETKDLNDKVFELNDIIDVKGEKAQGNQLTRLKIKDITLLDVAEGEEWPEESVDEVISASNESIENNEVPLDVADDKNDKKDLFGAAERMTAELEKRIKNKFNGLNG